MKEIECKTAPVESGMMDVMNALIKRIETKLGLKDTPENRKMIVGSIRAELRRRFSESQLID